MSIYNAEMPDWNAKDFGRALNEAYQLSRFKSHAALAQAVGLSRTTVSALISAKPQTGTNEPSRPKASNVIKLAKALNTDPDPLLLLAGHAPTSQEPKKPANLPELLEALDALGIEIDWATVKGNFDNYTPDDFEELKEQIAANAGIKIKRVTGRS